MVRRYNDDSDTTNDEACVKGQFGQKLKIEFKIGVSACFLNTRWKSLFSVSLDFDGTRLLVMKFAPTALLDRLTRTEERLASCEANGVYTYFWSSIWTAWYHPMPRLGAPHPTRITSACPALANRLVDVLTARAVCDRKACLATKAADCCIVENMVRVRDSTVVDFIMKEKRERFGRQGERYYQRQTAFRKKES